MERQNIKVVVSATWVFTALAIAIGANVQWPILVPLIIVGLLPPLALLLWWNEPKQTMSEAINKARR